MEIAGEFLEGLRCAKRGRIIMRTAGEAEVRYKDGASSCLLFLLEVRLKLGFGNSFTLYTRFKASHHAGLLLSQYSPPLKRGHRCPCSSPSCPYPAKHPQYCNCQVPTHGFDRQSARLARRLQPRPLPSRKAEISLSPFISFHVVFLHSERALRPWHLFMDHFIPSTSTK